MADAAAATPVAWNVTFARPAVDAGSVFAPTTVPSFHQPTVATPLPWVVCAAPVPGPPPAATEKVTLPPGTGLPGEWRGRMEGAVAAPAFTVALWLSPASIASPPVPPARPVAWKVSGLPV